ncbi:MAG: T4 RnlA family RNA ligase [Ginsengibacter sp.]
MQLNKELLQEMVNERMVNVAKHPSENLFIYNYSAKAQYDKVWNEITLMARGLILDQDLHIVARPFRKFFNLNELSPSEIPSLPFVVEEKLDGSLGILYWINDKPFIATRGSFDSKQAVHANTILHTKYRDTFEKIEKDKTYLFEIIYPENRIVIDYGDSDDLILLSIINNETGFDELLNNNPGFKTVTYYDGINDLEKIANLNWENKEGFVIKFENSFRTKIKFSEYIKLHRIVTGISNVAIWEYMKEGKCIEELLERVPDEFYNWVKQTQELIRKQYDEIYDESKMVFKEMPTRKETALYFQHQKHPSVLFGMLDGKQPDKIIWRMIRPGFTKAYKNIEG